MATQTAPPIACEILYTANELMVTCEDSKRGRRTLILDFDASDRVKLTSAEQTVLAFILDQGKACIKFTFEMVRGDLAVLKSIADKVDARLAAEAHIDNQERKAAFAAQEKAQEEAAFMSDPDFQNHTPPVEPPTPFETPVVPNCPLCQEFMVRLVAGTGWRCAAAGRWTGNRWTGCNGVRWDNVATPPAPPVVQTPPPAPAPTPAPVSAPIQQSAPRRTANQKKVSGTTSTTVKESNESLARTLGRGVTMLTTASAEQRIAGLQQVVDSASKDFVLLIYDIPQALASECPNPSYLLWKYGARINLSCWFMPAESLERDDIKRMLTRWKRYTTYVDDHGVTQTGVTCFVIPQDPMQRNAIRGIALLNLDEEIRRQHTSLIECLNNADLALKAAQDAEDATERSRSAAQGKRDNAQRAKLKKANDEMAAAIRCAEAFDMTMEVKDLLEGLRHAISARREAFNAEMVSKGSRPAK